jgi:hypothetical protein
LINLVFLAIALSDFGYQTAVGAAIRPKNTVGYLLDIFSNLKLIYAPISIFGVDGSENRSILDEHISDFTLTQTTGEGLWVVHLITVPATIKIAAGEAELARR